MSKADLSLHRFLWWILAGCDWEERETWPSGRKGWSQLDSGKDSQSTTPQDLSSKERHLGSIFQKAAGQNHLNSIYRLSRLWQKPMQAKLFVFSLDPHGLPKSVCCPLFLSCVSLVTVSLHFSQGASVFFSVFNSQHFTWLDLTDFSTHTFSH